MTNAPVAPMCELVSGAGHWYVGFTRPRQESRAVENLKRQGFECCLPLIQVQRRIRREVIWHQEALFPRYVFLRPAENSVPLERIRSTYGMSGLVRFAGHPATVGNVVVEQFVQLGETCRKSLFEQGESVCLVEGPLAGLQGVFERSEGEVRAVILLEFLQREQRVTVPASVLRAVH